MSDHPVAQQHVETETPVAEGGHTLQRNRTFLRTAPDGRVDATRLGDTGLFHRGTRFLSGLELKVSGVSPNLLDAGVDDDNLTLVVDLANPDLDSDRGQIPADTIHLRRTMILDDGAMVEKLELANYGRNPIDLGLAYEVSADFADVFEARGMARPQRGTLQQPEIDGDDLHLSYLGRDGVSRRTTISIQPRGTVVENGVRIHVELSPAESRSVELTMRCSMDEGAIRSRSFDNLAAARREEMTTKRQGAAMIVTSNPRFNAWIDRSQADLEMLTIETAQGPYPAAGAPWYVTTFGRDGIIAALQMLDYDPRPAAGVLRYLAAHQATESDPESDAAPGKIVHEMREGEMADLGEHRFGRYYGTIDATPLFLMLAGAYCRRTGDVDLMREIWPNVLAATAWIDEYGDLDGDGFVEYRSNASSGLVQQGWKDSHDSVLHADGSFARSPIALCEVQGYVYQGLLSVAEIAAELGEGTRASSLRERAGKLRTEFNHAFWDENLGSFVLALDGDKQPCRVLTTNAGHCLYAGIADPDHAVHLAATFSDRGMASGWGLRTLSRDAAGYNPLSYHNGSVWPHDNAIVAAGLARYGLKDAARAITEATFEAAIRTGDMRLPELYCGFQREPGRDPVRYPISCTPQAWAAGSVFMLLSALLGLEIDARSSTVIVTRPILPTGVEWISIDGLRIGQSVSSITLQDGSDGVEVAMEGDGVRLDIRD
ncbi:MAG: glycogen debranching N-terminal domain-containing protein [Thermomicrobiales bacterium]